MVLSPIVAALQPDSRATALNWLRSFYGIGTVITVLVATLAFRLGIGWRTISLTLVPVPLLVALGFVNVDLPPLISDKAGERTALSDLCRNSSFVAVNAAIFLGGVLELGLSQGLPVTQEAEGSSPVAPAIQGSLLPVCRPTGQNAKASHPAWIHRGFSRERIDQSALQVSCGELLSLVDRE
jgi:MFS family permease